MTDVTLSWDGPGGGELADPPVAEVRRRIEDLNGHDRTLVTLDRGGDYLAVGGSAEQGLVVHIEVGQGTELWQALSPGTPSAETVVVVAGGQPGDYPARMVTTLEVALSAATAYAESGQRSGDVRWEGGAIGRETASSADDVCRAAGAHHEVEVPLPRGAA